MSAACRRVTSLLPVSSNLCKNFLSTMTNAFRGACKMCDPSGPRPCEKKHPRVANLQSEGCLRASLARRHRREALGKRWLLRLRLHPHLHHLHGQSSQMDHVASQAVSEWARLPECRMAAQKAAAPRSSATARCATAVFPCGRVCGWSSSRRSSFFKSKFTRMMISARWMS